MENNFEPCQEIFSIPDGLAFTSPVTDQLNLSDNSQISGTALQES